MSVPEIPTSYSVASSVAVSGSLDMDLDEIRIKELPKIFTDSNVVSNSTIHIGLDNSRIREHRKINLCVELAMKPTRIHFPVNFKFGVKGLGMELLCMNFCGESMVVIEDYVPHKTEICR